MFLNVQVLLLQLFFFYYSSETRQHSPHHRQVRVQASGKRENGSSASSTLYIEVGI